MVMMDADGVIKKKIKDKYETNTNNTRTFR